jgi:UPF0176 protein
MTVILYYLYVPIADSAGEREWQNELCKKLGLKGRIKVGGEGINGTLGGRASAVQQYVYAMSTRELFADIVFKYSGSTTICDDAEQEVDDTKVFPNLWVQHAKAIIELGVDGARPEAGTTHLTPAQFHKEIEQGQINGDVVLLDCRNGYEHDVGTFEVPGVETVLPLTRHFTEFPQFADNFVESTVKPTTGTAGADKKVLMFCTGGIRCERASSYLLSRGVQKDRCFQLEGGIHTYLETFGEDGFFKGDNFVFDRRLALGISEHRQDAHSAGGNAADGNAANGNATSSHARSGAALATTESLPRHARCCRCDYPHGKYDRQWVCSSCKVLVLVCMPCRKLRPQPKIKKSLVCPYCKKSEEAKGQGQVEVEAATSQLGGEQKGEEQKGKQQKGKAKEQREGQPDGSGGSTALEAPNLPKRKRADGLD